MNSSPTTRIRPGPDRAYDLAMRRTVGLLLAAITIAACSGSDAAPPPLETAPAITPAPTTEAPDTIDSTEAPVSEPDETTTTDAPTTTIDEAAILAEAEAAYFTAWQVGTDAIRNPDDPDNESQARAHFAKNNLEGVLENIRLTEAGNFIAKENPDNPSFAQTYDGIKFTGDARDEVAITVCEFYSDRLFERGTAPDGSDTLVRDNPVTTIFVVEMILEDGQWKSATGGPPEVVNDEVERCSTAS